MTQRYDISPDDFDDYHELAFKIINSVSSICDGCTVQAGIPAIAAAMMTYLRYSCDSNEDIQKYREVILELMEYTLTENPTIPFCKKTMQRLRSGR